MSPVLTISVVSHGQREILQPLLEQLRHLQKEMAIEIVVTENMPSVPGAVAKSDIHEMALNFVSNAQPLGFGANHNRAFRFCRSPFFCVLNPDVRLFENPFPELMAALKRSPGIAAPRIVSAEGTNEDSARRLPTLFRLASRIAMRLKGKKPEGDYPVEGTIPVDWLAGMFLVFDETTFRHLGGFDERYHLYCEDVDICVRTWLANRSVTRIGGVSVCHDARRDSHRRFRYLTWHFGSMIALFASRSYWKFRCSALLRQ